MTLVELATRLVGSTDLEFADRIELIRAELDRRQKMLDSAERMAQALASEATRLDWRTSDVRAAWAEYEQAKGRI